jgi:hypothetical protein
MKNELRLKKTGGSKVRMNIAWFIVVLLLAAVIGFVVGQYGLVNLKTKLSSNDCINKTEMQFFIDETNKAQEDYAKCVKDAWNLQLLCKMQIDAWKKAAGANATVTVLNSTI